MRRFPLRTLILMVLALIVFVRMWIITHSKPAEEPGKPPPPSPGIKAVSYTHLTLPTKAEV